MKYALITTFETTEPYFFREILDEKIEGDFAGVIWVELPEDSLITPKTHKYTGESFVEIPSFFADEDTFRPSPRPIGSGALTNADQPVVM